MHLSLSVALPFLAFTTTALARGDTADFSTTSQHKNSTSSSNPHSQCRLLAHLSSQSSPSPQLAAMQSNSTLMAQCAAYIQEEEMDSQCRMMAKLEKWVSGEATSAGGEGGGRGGHKGGNNSNSTSTSTEGGSGQGGKSDGKKWTKEEATAKLQAMQANSTLVEYCAAKEQKGDCKELEKLEKWVAMAGNGTATAKGEGKHWSAKKMEKAKARLAELKGNATLVAACQAESGGESAKPTTTPVTVAGAGMLQPVGTMLAVGMGVVLGMLAL